MTLKQSISLIILSLSAPTLFGQAKSNDRGKVMEAVVAKYDTNKDGQLDEKERAVILKAFDLDGSGDLDKNEKRALAKALSGQPKPPVPSQPKPEQEETPAVSKWTTPGFQHSNTLGGGKADVPNAGVFRVFVLMGQSNMVGAAKASNLKSPYTDKHDRIRIWANGRWEYLVPRQQFGPEVSLAHQLADHWPDDTIGIIKVAVGGTGISAFAKSWSEERANRTFDGKKGPLYQDMINAVTEAKKNSRTEFSGFIWKQGGADGKRKDTADEYFDSLQQLISDIRRDVGKPNMPAFVLTYLSDEELNKLSADTFGKRAHIGTVMKAQNRAARDIPNTVTVHHGKLPLVDAVHFNHEGQVTLGKMTADAVEAFPKESKSVIPKELSQ